jgi:hypothetical protein
MQRSQGPLGPGRDSLSQIPEASVAIIQIAAYRETPPVLAGGLHLRAERGDLRSLQLRTHVTVGRS